MSYSVCIKCGEMVGGYEKYCKLCANRYLVKNDIEFHRTPHTKEDIESELRKDGAHEEIQD